MLNACINAAARFLTRVAAVFLLAMVALNVADVGLRALFNAPIFGTYEVIEILLGAVAFLAIPEAFLRREHITIELIDQVVPQRVVDWLQAFGTLLATVFVFLLAWHMIQPTIDYVTFNEITVDLGIPLIWKAVLILLGVAASVFGAGYVFVEDLKQALGRNG